MADPARGEIWLADLDPTRGQEQAGRRPCLIVSVDLFNAGPADLVIVIPISSRAKGVPTHVPVMPPEGGLKTPSFIRCEDVRSIAKERLGLRWGAVSQHTMAAVDRVLRILLAL